MLTYLQSQSNSKNVEGMKHFGISSPKAFGVPTPVLRKLAKQIGKNHQLALELWAASIYEARIIASFIAEPEKATEKLLEEWAQEFDNWAVCDSCCSNFFDKTSFAYTKAIEWTKRKEEYVKRAGFVLMAVLAVHDKTTSNERFIKFFPFIKKHSTDERNFVRKAVNWALRQIGKRNTILQKNAIALAEEIVQIDSPSARWIARDALRELKNKKTHVRKLPVKLTKL